MGYTNTYIVFTKRGKTKSAAPSLLPGKNVTNSCFSYYEHILSVRMVGKGLL